MTAVADTTGGDRRTGRTDWTRVVLSDVGVERVCGQRAGAVNPGCSRAYRLHSRRQEELRMNKVAGVSWGAVLVLIAIVVIALLAYNR